MPSITINRAKGQPVFNPATDFAMCIIGTSSATPVATGALSTQYGDPRLAVGDYGIGDGVDAIGHALTNVNGDNPQPGAIVFVSTHGTSSLTAGVRGTLTVNGVSSTAQIVQTPSTHPTGTYEPAVVVVDDGNGGGGTTVGSATAIVLQPYLDNERTKVLPQATLGTSFPITFTITIPNTTTPGSPYNTGVQYTIQQVLIGTTNASSSGLYGGGGTLNGETLILNVNGGGALTLTLSGAGNTATSAAFLAAIAVEWPALVATIDANNHLNLTNTAGATIVVGAGTANTTLGLTPGTYNATLKTGDSWTETKTVPPQWAVADLFTAGSPATGILMNIANSGLNFGLIVITEPAAASDIATLSAALTAMQAVKSSLRPTLILRFRDQAVGESDATYTAALATFRAACADDARIVDVAGDGWLTDALRGFVYSRNGLPSVLTRLQGMSVIAGRRGEKIAQDPGWGQRGPLPGFTIRDSNENPVGHDEKARPGGNQPVAGKGGFLTFYFESHEDVQGTYVFGAPSLYGTGSSVLTLMDNRVSSGIERALYSIAFDFLKGAEIVNTASNGQVTLDQDATDAMSGAAMKRIRDRYAKEFQNANDPNLVTVNPVVTVSGPNVTVTWYVNDRLYLYVDGIIITIANARP
jgi:hypothetical protein